MRTGCFYGRIFFLLSIFFGFYASAQSISGKVVDALNSEPLAGVKVALAGTALQKDTDGAGEFFFFGIPSGKGELIVSKGGYLSRRFPIPEIVEEVELGVIFLQRDFSELDETAIIALEDHELDDEIGDFSNVSGLLHAGKDVFLNAAAFDFSSTFFRPRGYDSQFGVVLINGIKMNKFSNGRPVWSNWGGLNDVQRNQVHSVGLTPSDVSFGGPAGTTNIIMRAAEYSKGGKVSYAVANRAYSGRVLASYSSGLMANNWAYTIAAGRRYAEESFIDGSIYDANSLFISVERKFNEEHSLNLAGFYTPNRRGKNSPNTEEVFELKGKTYNSYWGYHNGQVRNSRIKTVEEPVVMLNHYWNPGGSTTLTSGIAYQTGKVGNSRIDYGGSRIIFSEGGETAFVGGGTNPDPAYYQKMPSFFLRPEAGPNFTEAYFAREQLIQDGQINWSHFYRANETSTTAGGNSIYALYEDRNDDTQIWFNSSLNSRINRHLRLDAGVSHIRFKSENFARILDLLGGSQYLDVDAFSEGSEAQNDLEHPNRLVGPGERFKYDYDLAATSSEAFVQGQWIYKYFDFFAAAEVSHLQYKRTGNYRNGNFPDNSLGPGVPVSFSNYGVKNGVTWKLSGRNLFDLKLSHQSRAPTINNSYSNLRQNNNLVSNLRNQEVSTVDFGYIHRSSFVKSRITAFHGSFRNGIETSFYYADGLAGMGREATTAFVQEVLGNISKQHSGIELGLEGQVSSTLKLKAAGSWGKYVYNGNPDLYLTSDDFSGELSMGKAFLKGYHLPVGPQRVAQLGFEYRDPAFWWFSATANRFSKAYIDVAPLVRTKNFYTDFDGLPLLSYDSDIASQLVRQEDLGEYLLVNLVGGKSWKLKNRFLGFFSSVNNILNEEYRTGGYEQSRNVNYLLLKKDREREQPLFAPKYWFGPGTTYYAHVYVRF